MIILTRIVVFAMLLTLTAPALPALADPTTTKEVSAAGFLYTLYIDADPLEVMKPLPARIKINAPDGRPVRGATVTCSLEMPAMAMPLNAPTISATDRPGLYKGVFLVTMGGLWVAKLSTTYATGEKDEVVISIPYIQTEQNDESVNSKLDELFREKSPKKH